MWWDLTTLGVLAAGGPLIALAVWCRWYWALAAIGFVMGVWAAIAAAAGQPPYSWWSCGGMAIGCLAFAATHWMQVPLGRTCRSVQQSAIRLVTAAGQWIYSRGLRAVGSTALWAGLFLMIGPVLAAVWVAQIERASEAPDAFASDQNPLIVNLTSTPHQAFTDRGRAVPLLAYSADDRGTAALDETEIKLVERFPVRLIRTASPDPKFDCHGWVFTAGRFWIMSNAIDDILADNDYQEVTAPAAGDLIVYRNQPGGIVMHTGLVQSVTRTEVLIESKWGPLGRYLHSPAEQPFGKAWTFHRSSRAGHQLIIDDVSSETE